MPSRPLDSVAEPGDAVDPVRSSGQTSDGEPDQQLLGRIAGRDPEALEALYQRFRIPAFSVALRITGDQGLAEDAVQEAFLQAWRNASQYSSSTASVKTWLLGIVHHRAVDAMRLRRPTAELPDGEEVPEALTLPDVWPEVVQRLDRDVIQGALRSLTSSQREAIELAYFGGLTHREIALRTATPLGTVKSRVRDALIVLRRALRGELGLAGPQGAA